MFKLIKFIVLILALSSLPSFFQGSDLALAQADTEETFMEEIDIRGQVRREELKTTSATILTNEDVQNRITYLPLELLKQAAGIYIGFYGESGIAPNFYIRGLSGGHGGADITMYMDGIPLHDNGHATAYMDSGSIMPIEIESIEVIKGPSSVYYGQHSAGGAIPIQSIKSGNLTRLITRYGSYNDIDVSGLLARDIDKFSQVYAFQMYHTDGYRDNSDMDKKNFSGRWTYTFSDKFMLSLNLRAYQSEWNSAGYISNLQASSDYDWVNDGSGEGNGGKRDRYDGRLWANWFINDESQLTFYLYGSTLEHLRYQVNQRLLGSTSTSSGSIQNNIHKSYGTGLTYSFNGELWGRQSTATFGFTYMFEKEDPNNRYGLTWGSGRAHSATPSSSTTYSLSNPTILGEFTYQIIEQLNFRLGARYDWLSGSYTNNLTSVRSDSKTFHFFSPKAGILYTPSDWAQIYASFGRSFSTPGLSSGSTSFYGGSPFDLKTRDQVEIGARINPVDWLNFELALYRLMTKNDDTYDEQTNVLTPTGESVRQGIEFSVKAVPYRNLYFSGNYTYLDARYEKRFTGGYNYHGYHVTSVPRHMTNLELSYNPPLGFGGRISFHWESHAFAADVPKYNNQGVENTNPLRNYKLQDKGGLDLQLHYKFNDSYRVILDVANVMDKRYFGSQGTPNANGEYTYSVRPPRSFYLALEMNWDKK
jgi:iron complex outermembrane receptor protein